MLRRVKTVAKARQTAAALREHNLLREVATRPQSPSRNEWTQMEIRAWKCTILGEPLTKEQGEGKFPEKAALELTSAGDVGVIQVKVVHSRGRWEEKESSKQREEHVQRKPSDEKVRNLGERDEANMTEPKRWGEG